MAFRERSGMVIGCTLTLRWVYLKLMIVMAFHRHSPQFPFVLACGFLSIAAQIVLTVASPRERPPR